MLDGSIAHYFSEICRQQASLQIDIAVKIGERPGSFESLYRRRISPLMFEFLPNTTGKCVRCKEEQNGSLDWNKKEALLHRLAPPDSNIGVRPHTSTHRGANSRVFVVFRKRIEFLDDAIKFFHGGELFDEHRVGYVFERQGRQALHDPVQLVAGRFSFAGP
jgi:hypothetical protein